MCVVAYQVSGFVTRDTVFGGLKITVHKSCKKLLQCLCNNDQQFAMFANPLTHQQ